MQDFNQYIGIPFRPKGRDWEGLDCWGLLRLIYWEQFKVHLASYSEEYESIDKKVIPGIVEKEIIDWREIPKGEERTGDAILLRITGEPMHVAMVVSKGLMIHVMRGSDSIIEDYRSKKWEKRVLGFYRYDSDFIR